MTGESASEMRRLLRQRERLEKDLADAEHANRLLSEDTVAGEEVGDHIDDLLEQLAEINSVINAMQEVRRRCVSTRTSKGQ